MSTEAELKPRVEQLLASLGDNDDAVAERLKALGIKGAKNDGRTCPIYNFLRANGIPAETVQCTYVDFDEWAMSLPRAVQGFITSFDCGFYSDLEQEAES